jgi:putative nucleotidyltransferase with HDIG domain
MCVNPGEGVLAEGQPRPHPVGTVRTSEIVAALSRALDVTEGLPAGHAARTCYLALRLADRMGLRGVMGADLFYGALLKDLGCSSNAALLVELFGADDIELKRREALTERDHLAMALLTLRTLAGSNEPLPLRLRRLISLARGGADRHRIEQLRCERGADVARRAGFSDGVAEAIFNVHEHWDGLGFPQGRKGSEIPITSRIVAACAGVDVFRKSRGDDAAIAMLRARSGARYDPDIVEELLSACDAGLLRDMAGIDVYTELARLEPQSHSYVALPEDVDRIANAFADVIDTKSPFTAEHSKRVGAIASKMAQRLSMSETDVRDVRWSGLLHDIGKLGVPNTILDKRAALDEEEFAVIRRHPVLSLEILSPVAIFDRVAEIAACHHERLDGLGYFRGLTGESLGLSARVVAVADVYEALTAVRPYRIAMAPEEALRVMDRSTGDHLAAEAVTALRDVL